MPAQPPRLIQASPFIRALLAPTVIWGCMVGTGLLAHYPGVVCVTPMAWLLALVSGTRYVDLCAGKPDRYPLLAPALAGAVLGLEQGILFWIVSSLGMPAESAADAVKANWLSVILLLGGIFAGAACSTLTAWLRLRSLQQR